MVPPATGGHAVGLQVIHAERFLGPDRRLDPEGRKP
jgi:hypothetical protein